MKTTAKKGVGAIIGAWLLVKAQEFIAYTDTVAQIDWSAVGSTAISELMTGAVALIALFTRLDEPDRPVKKPDIRHRLDPEFDVIDDVPERPPVLVPTPIKTGPLLESEHFSQAELECKGQECNCTYPGMSQRVMDIVEELRSVFGPLIVNSAFRCAEHNKAVGGSDGSYHAKRPGRALDIRSAKYPARQLYDYMNQRYPKQFGLGLYKNFIHIDDRDTAYARKTGADANWVQYPLDLDLGVPA